MSLGTILLIVLIVLLIGAVPTWPHSSGWGYGPSGSWGTVLLICSSCYYAAGSSASGASAARTHSGLRPFPLSARVARLLCRIIII